MKHPALVYLKHFFFRNVRYFAVYLSASTAHAELGYTADYLTDTVYSFDVDTGAYTPLLSIPGGVDLVDLHAYSSKYLYGLGFNDRNLYAINLQDLSYSQVTTAPIGDSMELIYSVGVSNPNTAYVVGYVENNIYAVDIPSGTSTTLLTIAGNPGLTNIAIKNSTTAYVAGYNDNNLYEVDLAGGTYQLVTPVPIGFPGIASIEGLALASENLAYVTGNLDGNVYSVDLTTGAFSLITPVAIGPSIPLINLAVADGKGYTVNNLGGEIYKVNLLNGSYFVLANIPGTNLTGMTLAIPPITPINPNVPVNPSNIPLSNLKGNDLHLAEYLNEQAPETTIDLFYTLTGLASALESAAPTRNACSTYAAQLVTLGLSRVIHDHERQKRFQHQFSKEGSSIADLDGLFAGQIHQISSSCKPESGSTFWLSPFGGYTQVQPQDQTPSFNMKIGGIAAAWDYNGEEHNLFGIAGAYLTTSLHEHHSMGHGDVKQGCLAMYGSTQLSNWYFDAGLLCGHYWSRSVRHITFSGVDKTAVSHPQGWQLAPTLEMGYDRFKIDFCQANRFGIVPFLLSDWVADWEKGVHESGASPLNMGQKSRFCSLLFTELGLRCHETIRWKGGKAVLRQKLAYSYQKAFGTGTLQAFLVGSGGTFTLQTFSQAQNLGVVGFSLLILSDRPNPPYLDLWYEGEFGSGYQLQQITLEVGKNF